MKKALICKPTQSSKRQRGFMSLDATITMGIAIVLAAFAAMAIPRMNQSFKAWKVNDQINQVITAATDAASNSGVYTGMTIATLCTKKYINDDAICAANGSGANYFGGNLSLSVGSQPYEFRVTQSNIPEGVGNSVADKHPTGSYSSGTITIDVSS